MIFGRQWINTGGVLSEAAHIGAEVIIQAQQKELWCSGITQAFQAGGPGSIPGTLACHSTCNISLATDRFDSTPHFGPGSQQALMWPTGYYASLGGTTKRGFGTCGLVAMTSASHTEGRHFDPGQVYHLAISRTQTLIGPATK